MLGCIKVNVFSKGVPKKQESELVKYCLAILVFLELLIQNSLKRS